MPNLIKIDEIDRKLLFELDFDARQDLSILAKKLKISEKEADRRIYRLIQKGVIKGFHSVLDVPKVGYFYCRLFITLQSCPKEKEEDVLDYLINHPNIFWLFSMQGMYDYLIIFWVNSLTQFTKFIEEFENKFGRFIKRKQESIVTRLTYFQDRFLLGTRKTKEIHLGETKERIEIDQIDKRILQFLSINARFTLRELSLNVGETEEIIYQRIKKLERLGVIIGYRPFIDHVLLGYTWYKLWININKTSQRAFRQLFEYIKANPITLYIIEGIGLPADLEIEVMVSSDQELFNFINEMRIKFPMMIEDYMTLTFIETLKELYLPFY